MTDSSDQEVQENKISMEIASAEDLRNARLSTVLEGYPNIDDTGIGNELYTLAAEALAGNNISAHRGYKLLASLCTLRMPSDDPAEAWQPRFQNQMQRTLIPSDLRGQQNLYLAEIISEISHPTLRARVADVVWSNERKQYRAGQEAVKAYCQSIHFFLDTIKDVKENDALSLFELANRVQRAFYINLSMRRRCPVPDCLEHTFSVLYQRAQQNCLYGVFARLCEIAAGYKIKSFMEVAEDAERLVTEGSINDHPEARKRVWAIAARYYGSAKETASRRRCLGRYADETLRMCDEVSSYAAKASWIRQAIKEFQIAGGFQARVDELRVFLRDMQLASIDEMHQNSVPIDLSVPYNETQQLFSKLNIPDILLQFALLAESPTIEFLQKEALENRPTGFASLFPNAIHLDQEGKLIARTSSRIKGDAPDEEWFKDNSITIMNFIRHTVVEAGINPARRTIMLNFPLEARHFEPIVSLSYYVPHGHEHIYSLGFSRLLQGDFASAAYLLIPQLENTLRHILFCHGYDSFKMNSDGIQEDRSLSALLENNKSDLIMILGADIVNEIDMLFHFKAGPSLRHKIAHGKLTSPECYSTESVYACWFMYRMICLPLLRLWKEEVAPQIESTL
ncbi:DUF4209 domain-containing protein [Rouxiella silvae]|uniref:DUF4209 domain-containing protein n=1 Tax=Rouxiella silvae TaxID=1646373 RepID=UPI0039EF5BF9